MARMGYGWVAIIACLAVWSIAYIATNPAMAAMYASAQSMELAALSAVEFVRTMWQVMPLAVVIGVAVWGLLAGMGTATSPWRVIMAWMIMLVVQLMIMTGYIGLDTLFEQIFLMIQNPVMLPAAEFIRMIWHAYPIPLDIGLLLWAFVQSIAQESTQIYG